MTMHEDFGFIGRLCLDFAQTGDMGWGAGYERLVRPAELRRWLSLCPLHATVGRITAADLARAKRLRQAIWCIAQSLLDAKPPRASDIRRLNAEARRPALVRALGNGGESLEWYRPSFSGALASVAQDAVSLFGDAPQRARLKRCENPQCRIVFYDDSRPGARRWCASNRCGDRLRARAYRRRHG